MGLNASGEGKSLSYGPLHDGEYEEKLFELKMQDQDPDSQVSLMLYTQRIKPLS